MAAQGVAARLIRLRYAGSCRVATRCSMWGRKRSSTQQRRRCVARVASTMEDVPSSVELRWRPDDSQATFTISS